MIDGRVVCRVRKKGRYIRVESSAVKNFAEKLLDLCKIHIRRQRMKTALKLIYLVDSTQHSQRLLDPGKRFCAAALPPADTNTLLVSKNHVDILRQIGD